MLTNELVFLSVSELAGLIRELKVSPVELTKAYIERINALDFKLNSFITVFRTTALNDARIAEEEIRNGRYLGPLHGIPVAVKDQFWTKGIRTTAGSRIQQEFIPNEDATIINRLKQAGAIILGKTNLTEFAITGFSHRFSTPRNPWNIDMYTGGSSGGSAAATAGYLCATSLGEDTGGSIRFPASWCGLAGIRPSWGRVSRYGVIKGLWSMDTVGPISRCVEDAAITLGAIAGHDPNDPYSWKHPVPDYQSTIRDSIKNMRVALVTDGIDREGVDPEVRTAVYQACDVIKGLGANVEEVSIPLADHAGTISAVLMATETAANHRDWIKTRTIDYGHDNRIALQTGSIMPAQAYYKAQQLRALIRDKTLETLKKYSILLMPTTGTTAQLIKDDQPVGSKNDTTKEDYLLRRIWNLTGAPALSVRCGFDNAGLPIGLQIGGKPFDEATVLRLGYSYEQSTEWHKKRPPDA
ncbi:Asp-tRNA(Asn)/Glu-tRNA(Gln) amidotransferase subunit GatA [SAR202 cluster bacterium AD-804-J14_MRT_500m]|nr:Asp-tRNA(Asn)/Glu-tRNA(Gln) amidotransferase subunit GatA [SAR202 cluster bacterium AD-804-J14_MRT_500m]